MRVVSEPTLGSVTPKQARSVPSISGGSMRRFCSSVPNTTTGCGPNRFRCTDDTAAEPSLPMVRITIAAAEIPRPAPPCSLGMVTPNQPPRATASQNSLGQRPSRSRSSQ